MKNIKPAILPLILSSFAVALNFDSTLVIQSKRASDLSHGVYFPNGNGIPNNSFYSHGPDAALFVRENNICWASFRGSLNTLDDWLQNLNPGNRQVCPQNGGACCNARQGYVDAYKNPNYHGALNNQIRQCKRDCPSCQVILTGHSQGGAIAAVAAVELSDLNPIIITFGQPASIIGGCGAINVNRYYRFVTAYNEPNDLDYDPVPSLNLDADQMGFLILLGQDGNNVVAYENGRVPNISPTDWDYAGHPIVVYRSNVQRLNNHGVSTNGFAVGYGCNQNEECRFPARCVVAESTCRSGLNGDPCSGDEDCQSRRCEGVLTTLFSGRCEGRLGSGSTCNEDSDCQNGDCRWYFRCN